MRRKLLLEIASYRLVGGERGVPHRPTGRSSPGDTSFLTGEWLLKVVPVLYVLVIYIRDSVLLLHIIAQLYV